MTLLCENCGNLFIGLEDEFGEDDFILCDECSREIDEDEDEEED